MANGNHGYLYDNIDKRSLGKLDAGLEMMQAFASGFDEEDSSPELSSKEIFIKMCEAGKMTESRSYARIDEINVASNDGNIAILITDDVDTTYMIKEDNTWKIQLYQD